MRNKHIGFILGLLIALLIYFLPLQGLGKQGQVGLALTLMTVVFWAFQIAQTGYTSGLYLVLLVILKVAEPAVIFGSWLGSTMYLIIGAYLIAEAVQTSGLGERIAYIFILRFVTSFKSVLVSIFILTFALSLLIPHPWPRAFLIMSVMMTLIESTKMNQEDARKIGFTVFASSVPVSLIFLTGDSVLNPLAIQYSHSNLGWMGWFKVMGVPAIFASIATCILILKLFKPKEEITIDKHVIRSKLHQMGKISAKEKKIIVWLAIAITLWSTDTIHGIDIGWITFLIAMAMSLPLIGGLITPKSWKEVPVQVLIFITAAIAIGTVGSQTGMNAWLANALLPTSIPSNLFALAGIITTISIIIHMFLGSVIAVMGVAIPALLISLKSIGIDPLVTTLWVYSAIAVHYILPFHHLTILVGQGEENGLYSQRESIKLGLPLLLVTYAMTVIVELFWWKIIGLL